MTRAERRHPEKVAADPAVCETRGASPERMRRLASIGGYARAASMTPDELSAQMKKVRAARTAKDAARREAAGLPPVKPTPKPLGDDEMAHWKAVVDERFGVDYPWANRMQRARMAVRLAREAAARAAAEAFQQMGRDS